MIRSYRTRWIEAIAAGRRPKGFPADLVRGARQKLAFLDSAARLEDLRMPRGNRLEGLKGDRTGQYSIRINDQWRIVSRWTDSGAEDVDIVDYH